MAIKSKGRTKSKGVARAPRREPVVVKPAFFHRRWVQLIGSVLAGAAVVLVTFWVIHGLRADHAASEARVQGISKLAAANRWKSTVEDTVGTIGTLNQGAQPPSILPTLTGVIGKLQKGSSIGKTAADIKKAANRTTKAATDIAGFDLAGTISQKGFKPQEALSFTDSKSELATTFRLYAKAAQLAVAAADASGPARVAFAKAANDFLTEASTQLSTAWSSYQEAMFAGGVSVPGPLGGNAGVPGLSGTTP